MNQMVIQSTCNWTLEPQLLSWQKDTDRPKLQLSDIKLQTYSQKEIPFMGQYLLSSMSGDLPNCLL